MATISEFSDAIADHFGVEHKLVALIARRLREADRLPTGTQGQGTAIGPREGAALLLAVLGASLRGATLAGAAASHQAPDTLAALEMLSAINLVGADFGGETFQMWKAGPDFPLEPELSGTIVDALTFLMTPVAGVPRCLPAEALRSLHLQQSGAETTVALTMGLPEPGRAGLAFTVVYGSPAPGDSDFGPRGYESAIGVPGRTIRALGALLAGWERPCREAALRDDALLAEYLQEQEIAFARRVPDYWRASKFGERKVFESLGDEADPAARRERYRETVLAIAREAVQVSDDPIAVLYDRIVSWGYEPLSAPVASAAAE